MQLWVLWPKIEETLEIRCAIRQDGGALQDASDPDAAENEDDMLMDLDTPEADNEHFCLEKMAVTWFAKHEVFTHSPVLQKHGSNTNATSHFGFPLPVKPLA